MPVPDYAPAARRGRRGELGLALPADVKSVAMASIVYGILVMAFSLVALYLECSDDTFRPFREDSLLWTLLVIDTVRAALIAGALLVGGMGAQMLRPWARVTLLYTAIVGLCTSIVSILLTFFWAPDRMEHISRSSAEVSPLQIIGMVISLSLFAWIIAVMNREDAIVAFEMSRTRRAGFSDD